MDGLNVLQYSVKIRYRDLNLINICDYINYYKCIYVCMNNLRECEHLL